MRQTKVRRDREIFLALIFHKSHLQLNLVLEMASDGVIVRTGISLSQAFSSAAKESTMAADRSVTLQQLVPCVVAFVILLVVNGHAFAQTLPADASPVECWQTDLPCADPGDGPIHRAITKAAAQAGTSASASIENHRDERFQIVLGAFITAAGTDLALSMYKIGNGSAREAGFGTWWQDSPVAFAVSKSAISALFAYQLERLHRTHPRAAFALGIVDTAIEAALVARSAGISSPAK